MTLGPFHVAPVRVEKPWGGVGYPLSVPHRAEGRAKAIGARWLVADLRLRHACIGPGFDHHCWTPSGQQAV